MNQVNFIIEGSVEETRILTIDTEKFTDKTADSVREFLYTTYPHLTQKHDIYTDGLYQLGKDAYGRWFLAFEGGKGKLTLRSVKSKVII